MSLKKQDILNATSGTKRVLTVNHIMIIYFPQIDQMREPALHGRMCYHLSEYLTDSECHVFLEVSLEGNQIEILAEALDIGSRFSEYVQTLH